MVLVAPTRMICPTVPPAVVEEDRLVGSAMLARSTIAGMVEAVVPWPWPAVPVRALMGTTIGTADGRLVPAKMIGMVLAAFRPRVVFRTLESVRHPRTSLSSTRLAVDPTPKT